MSTISAEREQEYGVPYGEYAVNADMDYINSNGFAKKFDRICKGTIFMKKPEGVGEWDGYPGGNIPANRKPLPKEEEDKLIAEMHERIKKRIEEREEKQKKVV